MPIFSSKRYLDVTRYITTYKFKGTLKKIQLVSNIIGLGPLNQNEEAEQHLIVTDDGKVSISRYSFNGKLIERRCFSISGKAVETIMKEVSSVFKKGALNCYAMDAGMWYLKLMNTNGKFFDFKGSSSWCCYSPYDELSELIRVQLACNNLLVFNGNPNYITRIEVNYHRRSKSKEHGDVTDECSEHLTIDRTSQTLEYIKEADPGIKITNTCYIPDEIIELLDNLRRDGFYEIEGDSPDVFNDPNESKDYNITIFTKHGEEHTVRGTFDKNGLPMYWERFIEIINKFVASYVHCELFDKSIYGKPKRRRSDLIFCNVTFEDGGQTYSYIADSDDYFEGDLAVVPAGQDNHEAVVRIESIEYRQADDAPFPLEKTKHILRKYEDEDEDC